MSVIKDGCQSSAGKSNITSKGWAKTNNCEVIVVGGGGIEEMKWNREEALKNIKDHCNNFEDFNFEDFNFEEYKKGFAWVADGDVSNITLSKGFKILHHNINKDDELVVSRDGVLSALEVMGDQRSKGIPAKDRGAVYEHLAKHAQELDLPYKNFEDIEKSFNGSKGGGEKVKLKNALEALARKLDLPEGTDQVKILGKAFDSIVAKAVVVKFASLEPAVVALEADFASIDLEGKTIDSEHKALFKRLVDITAIIQEKELTEAEGVSTAESEATIETPKVKEEETVNNTSFLDSIDEAFDGVDKSVEPRVAGEVAEKIKELRDQERNIEDLFKI